MVWTCSQGDTETPLFLHANPPLLLPPPVLGPTEGALPPCSQSACVFFFFFWDWHNFAHCPPPCGPTEAPPATAPVCFPFINFQTSFQRSPPPLEHPPGFPWGNEKPLGEGETHRVQGLSVSKNKRERGVERQ